jgi:putative ABC transport system permease protein
VPDLRFVIRMAMRALRAAPLVSLLAILCIGLGIGSFTTVYSTAAAFTFHPLPQLGDPERLLLVADVPANALRRGQTVAPGTFADLASLPELSSAAALTNFVANIIGEDLPERADGVRVSAEFFRAVGRTPMLGRTFVPDEMVPGADRVVILSHGLWQRRFGRDSAVVGRIVRINGDAWTVVGIMPEDFVFPAGTQLWAPLALTTAEATDRTNRNLMMMARLAPGVSVERGQLAVRALGQRLASTWPGRYTDRVLYAQRAEEVFGEGPRPFMIVLLSAVTFLLLIACANVANLLLARATARQRETGVRIALGATRARIVGERLAESLLLALAGGALGLLVAWWGVHATATTVPLEVQQYIPGFGAIRLDQRALVLAAAVSMLSGLLFGIVPALLGSRMDVVTSLKDAGRSESRRSGLRQLRSALVVGEIALALMLVVGAALMVTTFRRLSVSYPGFRTDMVLTGRVTLPESGYPTDSAVVQFWDRLREAVAVLPGMEAAEMTTVLPMTWNEQRAPFHVERERPLRPEDVPSAGIRSVSPGFLRALDVGLLSGRWIESTDAQDAPKVALLSESAARRFFPRGDAVGGRLASRDRVFEIVGIVRDVRANPLTSNEPLDVVYVPLSQSTSRTVSLVIRAREDPASLTPALQRAIGRLDARLAVGEVTLMGSVVRTVTSPQSATAQTLLASAIIALVMAIVGTYGVISYVTGRRTHEIGVRVALGASHGAIVRLVVAGVSRLVLAGVVVGTVGALALGRGMQAILFDTSPSDLRVIAGAAVLLGAAAFAAGYIPARRAAAVSPLVALRSD